MLDTIFAIDRAILLFTQDHLRCTLGNWIAVFLTYISNAGLIWLALGAVLLFFKKTRRVGFDLLLAVAFCWIINDPVIKNLVQRPRPFTLIPELQTVVARPGSLSFPSGHTCSSMAAAFALRWGFGKKGGFFYIPAVLIALSRIYVGVHYPTDVLAGALWGTLGAFLACWFSRKTIHWKWLAKE